MGYIVLQGGNEFNGQMRKCDLQAVTLCGGPDAKVVIIPAAAAPDNNHERAGQNGVRWFKSLGATQVATVPLIDQTSADDVDIAEQLRTAKLIYLLGGFPGYLAQTLNQTRAAEAIEDALENGAVLAGSSAGAMVLCDQLYDPTADCMIRGLGFVAKSCVIPHHNRVGDDWAQRLGRSLPETTLIGIDEETGMISDGNQNHWTVYGRGGVTLYTKENQQRYEDEMTFALPRFINT